MNSDALYVARGIGIILVVFGHMRVSGGDLLKVYAFHMPLFFFLSGMVLDHSRPLVSASFRHMKRTLGYYAATAAILATITMLIFIPLGTGVASTSPLNLETYLTLPFTKRSTHIELFIVGWFLIALALARPIAHICLALVPHIMVALPVAIALAYFGMDIAAGEFDAKKKKLWYWNIAAQVATAAAFCILGAITQRYLRDRDVPSPIFIVAVTYALHIAIGNKPLSMAWSRYPLGWFQHLSASLAAIAAVLALSAAWQNSAILKTIGRYSRAVMSYHSLVIAGISLIVAVLGLAAVDQVERFTVFGKRHTWAVYLAASVGLPVLGGILYDKWRVRLKRPRRERISDQWA